MKIGILTFHWGTNYGAILQAYCLQEYLKTYGYLVSIINYKPRQYDFLWSKYIKKPWLIRNINRDLINKKKELLLKTFRDSHLDTTRRYFLLQDLIKDIDDYDVLISGSDQVLNPGFTISGENGRPSTAYWLNYGNKDIIRLGYAVSFGCEKYPENAIQIAKQQVDSFNAIGVREKTGMDIIRQLGYKGPINILPDPTLLLGKELFKKLRITLPQNKCEYTCVYMLRHEVHIDGNVRYIDEKHHPLTMEQWLETIVNAGRLITNSYHGVIMAILSHVPFVVLLETGDARGMNDRFYTLFRRLGVENRLVSSIEEASVVLKQKTDFEMIDNAIDSYRKDGIDFLNTHVCKNN